MRILPGASHPARTRSIPSGFLSGVCLAHPSVSDLAVPSGVMLANPLCSGR